ncbi:MAG: hypothetical protein M0P71_00715 [Melioribacteraceae bacterium]|nr:hypothetical protein [Melioribacteraceae bacterium]
MNNEKLYKFIIDPNYGSKLAPFSNILTMTCMINPIIARMILKNHNLSNRKISAFCVRKLKRQIMKGLYVYVPQHSISFDIKMNLFDFQHVLTALADCPESTSIPVMIHKNCPPEIKDLIDTGKRRTLSNILEFERIANPQVISKIINITNSYYNNNRRIGSGDISSDLERKKYYLSNRIEFNNRLEEMMKYEAYRIAKFAHRKNRCGHSVENYKANIGWYAGFNIIFSRVCADDAKKFFEQLMSDRVEMHPAVAHLKEFIMSGDIIGYGTVKKCTAMVLTWNAFRSKAMYQRSELINLGDATDGVEAI